MWRINFQLVSEEPRLWFVLKTLVNLSLNELWVLSAPVIGRDGVMGESVVVVVETGDRPSASVKANSEIGGDGGVSWRPGSLGLDAFTLDVCEEPLAERAPVERERDGMDSWLRPDRSA